MSQRSKVILWIGGVILLFGLIFLIYAIDTNKIGIFADTSGPKIQDASQLTELPSPDQSTFQKMYTCVVGIFTQGKCSWK